MILAHAREIVGHAIEKGWMRVPSPYRHWTDDEPKPEAKGFPDVEPSEPPEET